MKAMHAELDSRVRRYMLGLSSDMQPTAFRLIWKPRTNSWLALPDGLSVNDEGTTVDLTNK